MKKGNFKLTRQTQVGIGYYEVFRSSDRKLLTPLVSISKHYRGWKYRFPGQTLKGQFETRKEAFEYIVELLEK